MLWSGLLVASAACYVLKLAGLSLPARVIGNERVQRVGVLMPVALLVTLVVIQTFASGKDLQVDARLAGVGVALVAQAVRAPFLVVVFLAALTAAVLRAI